MDNGFWQFLWLAVAFVLIYEFFPSISSLAAELFPTFHSKHKIIREHFSFKKFIGWAAFFAAIFWLVKKADISDIYCPPAKELFFKILECAVCFVGLNLLFKIIFRNTPDRQKNKYVKARRLANWAIFIYLIAGLWQSGAVIFEKIKTSYSQKEKVPQEIAEQQTAIAMPVLEKLLKITNTEKTDKEQQ